MFQHFQKDASASLVVFLVALPLCLGIALASGAPPIAGLIAGIIGGIVVGAISGSSVGVSGPAAGLAVIVFNGIQTMPSYEVFALAVVIGGAVQFLLGLLRAGVIGLYFPNSVIQGMLTAIGLIIMLKQIPHAVGYDVEPEGSFEFAQDATHNTISDLFLMFNYVQPSAILISLLGLGILIFWESSVVKRQSWSQFIPGPLVAVGAGMAVHMFTLNNSWALDAQHLVVIPEMGNGWGDFFVFPEFSAWKRMDVWTLGVTIAVVASIETLLCVEATDKLDPAKRVTPTNRELLAQGTGNVFSGLIGGLPITQVIVRSSANIQSGGKTKMSAILHGFLLMASVFMIPQLLSMIPLASLAAVLLVVGYKLAKPVQFMKIYQQGARQFIPFVVTVLAIIFTDLLVGIGIGLIAAILLVLWDHFHQPVADVHSSMEKQETTIRLGEDVTFLHKVGIRKLLLHIPKDHAVIIDCSRTVRMDTDVKDIIEEAVENSVKKGKDWSLKMPKSTSGDRPMAILEKSLVTATTED